MLDPNDIPPLQRDLLRKNIIEITGEVNETMAKYVLAALALLETREAIPDIEVRIASAGGDCAPGFCIYETLRHYPGRTTAKVLGQASSMAVVILQACTQRLCAKSSVILVHHATGTYTGKKILELTPALLSRDQREIHDMETKICRVYAQRSGLPIRKIRALSKEYRNLTAQEALRLHLVDELF